MTQVNLSSGEINELLAAELEPALKSTDWDALPASDWDALPATDVKEELKKTIYAISDIHTEFMILRKKSTMLFNGVLPLT